MSMTLRFLRFLLPLLCRTAGLHLILTVGLWICSSQLLEEIILVFLMMTMGGSGHRTLGRQDKLYVKGFVAGLVFQSLHLRTFLVSEVGQFRLRVPHYNLLGLRSISLGFHVVPNMSLNSSHFSQYLLPHPKPTCPQSTHKIYSISTPQGDLCFPP